MTLDEAKSFKYIEVTLHGQGHVHWTETRTTGTGENRRTETISYTSNETYVQQKSVLWNSEQTPHGKIGPGSYSFQFQFIIPPQCPSSFRGSVGYIHYHLLGRIGTGLFRFDHRIEAPIQVSQLIDINQPQFQVPVRQTQRKQVGCFCCAAGDIEYTVDLPRNGFCINGDHIPLSVVVDNGSSRQITLRAEITRLVTYYAQGHRRYDRNVIQLVESEPILPRTTHTWTTANFVVPGVEPSISTSHIIFLEYAIKVSAVIPYSINPSVTVPVILGNVPFQGSVEGPVTAPVIDFSGYPPPDSAFPPEPQGASAPYPPPYSDSPSAPLLGPPQK